MELEKSAVNFVLTKIQNTFNVKSKKEAQRLLNEALYDSIVVRDIMRQVERIRDAV